MGKWLLLFIALFVGLGACAGGMIAWLSWQPLENGDTYMGLSHTMLRHTPFSTFLVPGIFLFLVLGLGNLSAALLMIRKKDSYLSMCMGGCLVAWILIQVGMLRGGNGLHVFFLLIGFLQFGLSRHIIRVAHQHIPFSAHQN